jgi:hypothetical protein
MKHDIYLRAHAVELDKSKRELEQITKIPKREFMRRGINQHTLEKICKGQPVRAIKLFECLKVLRAYRADKLTAQSSD